MSCNCGQSNSVEYTSQIKYDGQLFTCPGSPDFIVRPCDSLNSVISQLLENVCTLLSAGGYAFQNIGGGEGIYAGQNGAFQEFKSLIGGPYIGITATATEITISNLMTFSSPDASIGINLNGNNVELTVLTAPGGGQNNTGANIGGGTGVFAQMNGAVLEFKTLIAGPGVNITSTIDEITISAPCGCNAWTNDEIIDISFPVTADPAGAVLLGSTWVVPVGAGGTYTVIFNVAVNQAGITADAAIYINVNGTPVSQSVPFRSYEGGGGQAVGSPRVAMWTGVLNAGDTVGVKGHAITGGATAVLQQATIFRSGI